MQKDTLRIGRRHGRAAIIKKDFIKNRTLYLLVLPVLAYFIIFHYIPMFGVHIAFKEYRPGLGFLRSQWVGLKHFRAFFESPNFLRLTRNTILLNVYSLVFGFPAPVLLALLLNEVRNAYFKKIVQTVSYLPHFISLVVICGMIRDFVGYEGFITNIFVALGGERVNLLQKSDYFRTIFVASGMWQNVGWGSIIYFAALSSIDPELYQAAIVDGAGRLKQAIHITIPGILPTVIILLILNLGRMMNVSYEKVILLYNPSTYETADVISSYVYRKGLEEMKFSFSSAVGLFNSVINLVFLVSANYLSRRFTDSSLW
jgi:putative aldouronate transport system permease protein